MSRITFTLRIERPDEIDADTMAAIEEASDAQDETLDAKIARWVGDAVQDAEDAISSVLPEGWYAAIDSDE